MPGRAPGLSPDSVFERRRPCVLPLCGAQCPFVPACRQHKSFSRLNASLAATDRTEQKGGAGGPPARSGATYCDRRAACKTELHRRRRRAATPTAAIDIRHTIGFCVHLLYYIYIIRRTADKTHRSEFTQNSNNNNDDDDDKRMLQLCIRYITDITTLSIANIQPIEV